MTYTPRGRNYSIDTTSEQKTSPEPPKQQQQEKIDSRTTKRFLTNSDKSVFSLKWEVGGAAQQHYERSRTHSQHNDIAKTKSNSSPRRYSHKHHHHHQYQEEPEYNNETVFTPSSTQTITDSYEEKPPERINYVYPYAYPPMPDYHEPIKYTVEMPEHIIKPQKPVRIITKTTKTETQQPIEASQQRSTKTITGIRQSEKSLNLIHGTTKLKIEHHYVDSAEEAQRLIDNLRRKGFIETGIETIAVSPNKKKK